MLMKTCIGTNVVNALLLKLLPDPYQSRYNSWFYQCHTWARSHRLQYQHGHKLANYQCQTNGHNLIGFNVNRDTSTPNYQCQPNGHNHIDFNVNRDTSPANYQCPTMGTISEASMSTGIQAPRTISANPMGTIS